MAAAFVHGDWPSATLLGRSGCAPRIGEPRLRIVVQGTGGSMKLLLRRSQRAAGLTGGMIFCLDARADLSDAEKENVQRYRLGGQVIYNSEASKRALAKSEAAEDGSLGGNLKSLAFAALAAMKLNISIASLQRGHHIECKSLDELLGAEEAIMSACGNLRGYLDTTATFDGREVVIDFSAENPTIIAQALGLEPLEQAASVSAPPAIPLTAPPAAPEPAELVRYERLDGEAAPIIAGANGNPTAPGPSATGDTDGMVKLVLLMAGAFVIIVVLFRIIAGHPNG